MQLPFLLVLFLSFLFQPYAHHPFFFFQFLFLFPAAFLPFLPPSLFLFPALLFHDLLFLVHAHAPSVFCPLVPFLLSAYIHPLFGPFLFCPFQTFLYSYPFYLCSYFFLDIFHFHNSEISV